MTFFEDWKNRYLNGVATIEHLQRLVAIGKLTEQEYREILIEERKKQKGMAQ